MNKCYYFIILLSFSFVFILFSCSNDDEISHERESFTDTSIYVTSSSTKDSIIVHIGLGNSKILQYNVFPPNEAFKRLFRCPTIALTNKGTTLVACDNRTNDDKGEIELLLARKERQSDTWKIYKIFPYDSKKGRSMSPMFLVDSITGRIYLFAIHFANNNKYGSNHLASEMDYVYKYSDDDGLSWSDEYSLKEYWSFDHASPYIDFSLFYNKYGNNEGILWSNGFELIGKDNYSFYAPSCVKGLMLDNRIMLVPSIKNSDGLSRSVLLICEEGKWRFSQPTPNIGDNECTVYLDNSGRIVLDCRTYDDTRHKYNYDMESDSFSEISPSIIGSNVAVSTEIVNDKGLFYMCFPDSPKNVRENLTFYGSKDGVNWIKIYRMIDGNLGWFGYSGIAVNNEQLLACYETPNGVFVQDISAFRDYIRNMIIN